MTRHLAAGTVAVCTGKPPTAGAELTATRDLLTAENARLQKERDAAVNMEADTARRSSAEIDALRPPDGSGIRPRC